MRLPWSVLFLLEFLARELEGGGRMEKVLHVDVDLGIAFRADAKAEGQLVVVGGWECIGGRRPADALWFSVQLTRKSAPWAFSKGEPFRTIAALELFGTLLCVVLFGDKWPRGSSGTMLLEGITDNLGNTFSMSKLMTSKFPLVTILAELAAQLRSRAMGLKLSWTPREQNEEADALTNGNFSAFCPWRRLEVDMEKLEWILLPEMLKAASEIYERAKESKAAALTSGHRAAASAPGHRPLREREPW